MERKGGKEENLIGKESVIEGKNVIREERARRDGSPIKSERPFGGLGHGARLTFARADVAHSVDSHFLNEIRVNRYFLFASPNVASYR